MKEKVANVACNDAHCPFHSNFKTHGSVLVGKVIKMGSAKTIQIEIQKLDYIQKYERYEKKRIRIHAHNPPCIKVNIGDTVTIMECRPISKTKNFVVIKNETN
jgi:small subunit ribosomal protein S17